MKRIGFTGTKQGLTEQQWLMLRLMLVKYDELHHGDCIGADVYAHQAAIDFRLRVVIHPPSNAKYRAFCGPHERIPYLEFKEVGDYHVRDRRIVIETGELIACPKSAEYLRSGTWATVRYARSQGVPIHIIMPDGSVRNE